MSMGRLILLTWVALPLTAQTLETVKQEQNLTRRSQRALELAERELTVAQGVVREFGSKTQLQAALDIVAEASELALQALRETGRPPRRLSGQYKRGELKTRDFLKKLGDLEKALSLDDRPMAEASRKRVFEVHEEFLLGVMGQKRK